MTATHHDARPLTKDEGAQLYEHIRAIEALEEEKKEIAEDINERKTLCCERLPINKDVLNFVIKRRKAGRATCGNFDTMLELVEEAVQAVEYQRRHAGPATSPASPEPVSVTVMIGSGEATDDDEDEDDETEPELVGQDPY